MQHTTTLTDKEHAEVLAAQCTVLIELLRNLPQPLGFHSLQLVNRAVEAVDAYEKRDSSNEWVRGPEAAERLGITPRTLHRWRQDGRLTPGLDWKRLGGGRNNLCEYNMISIDRKMKQWALSRSRIG